MKKYSDVINIRIKLIEDDLERDEKKDLIISNLKFLIDELERTNGAIQNAKGTDDYSSMTYTHLAEESD